MFSWLRKPAPLDIQLLSDDSDVWGLARATGSPDNLLVRFRSTKDIFRHPLLSRRLGVATEHKVVDGHANKTDPVYSDIEDKLIELLAGPPRVGVMVLCLRDARMIEWVSYVGTEPQAKAIADTLMHTFAQEDVTATSALEPKWLVYSEFAPR